MATCSTRVAAISPTSYVGGDDVGKGEGDVGERRRSGDRERSAGTLSRGRTAVHATSGEEASREAPEPSPTA
eukprot:4480643-Alexandrium_andersonii.AAC.1